MNLQKAKALVNKGQKEFEELCKKNKLQAIQHYKTKFNLDNNFQETKEGKSWLLKWVKHMGIVL